MLHKYKKFFSLLLALAVTLSLPLCAKAQDAMPVTVNAKSAILMDATTGKVLMAKNEHEKLYPASVTKIMPLLLFAEALDSGKISLTDSVTASAVAAGKGGSQIWLKEGETMTVEELLKATAIYSANDACTALGEYLAGSEEAFIKMMNDRAAALGMKDSHFDNCTGLDDTTTTHQTTAYDIALMSRELLKHDKILEYTTIWMDSLRGGATELVNTNKLVRFYEGATGLKTGTTAKAGCCLSATAKRENTHLIAVIMGASNSNDRFNGAKAMLNWGFANYATVAPHIDPKLIAPVKVLGGTKEQIQPTLPAIQSILVPKDGAEQIEPKVDLALDVSAPVEKGQQLGKIMFTLNGETVGEYPLLAPEAVGKLTFPIVWKRLLASLLA